MDLYLPIAELPMNVFMLLGLGGAIGFLSGMFGVGGGFLLTPLDADPGTIFAYNQPCTYTLGRIVQRGSGQTLIEYLRPRLFEPLGIGAASWFEEPAGTDLGFSGLHTTVEMPEPTRSDCHAWGAYPMFHAYATFAGIRPASPGFKSVEIRPLFGPLRRICAKLPHPRGFVTLDISKSPSGAISGTASCPCTRAGAMRMWRSANRRRVTLSMSRIAAPVGDVTMPMRRGSAGSGRLRACAKRPSASSLRLSASNCAIRSPSPACSRACTTIWYVPRGS